MVKMIYDEGAYPEGTLVRIAPRAELDAFLDTWKFHHKLQADQLQYADRTARVCWIGYYHGGDVLYQLEGVPGIWHERCLRVAPTGTNSN